MIPINQAAADYTWHIRATMVHQRAPDNQPMVGGVRMDLGFGEGFPLWGRIFSAYDAGDAFGRWKAELRSVDLSISEEEVGTNWQDALYMRIEADDATLVAAACNAWQFDCTAMRWYVKVGAAAEYLAWTSPGALTLSGDNYDARDNELKVSRIAGFGTEDTQLAVLPHEPAFQNSFVYDVEVWAEGGQSYGGAYKEVNLDEDTTPPGTGCDCEEPMVGIDLSDPPPPTTTMVAIYGRAYWRMRQVFVGEFTCYCAGGTGIPTIATIYRMEEQFKLINGTFWLRPYDAGLRSSIATAKARCSDPIANPFYFEDPFSYATPVTRTTEETYIGYTKTVDNMVAYKTYSFTTQVGSCGISDPEDPNPPIPEPCWPLERSICFYEAEQTFDHAKPPCSSSGECHQWRDNAGRMYVAIATGEVIDVWRHNFNGVDDMERAVAANGLAQGAFHPAGRHHLVYKNGSTLYEIQNSASCEAGKWSAPVTIGNYTYFAFAIDLVSGDEYLVYLDGTNWKCKRKKPTETSFTTVGTVIANGGNAMAALEVETTGARRVVAIVRADSTTKRLFSKDQGVNWSE